MSSDQLRVLVCDDRPESLAENCDAIETVLAHLGQPVDVATLTGQAFLDEIGVLERRREFARESGLLTEECVAEQFPSSFDKFDVVILDYDLLKLEQALDGETTAYRVRCYSAAPYVIVINETRVTNEFDLRMLPRLESSADLLCNGRDLGNRGLWSPGSYGYRPWSWPVLPMAVRQRRQLVALLAGNMDEPLAKLMNVPQAAIDALPPDLVDVMGGPSSFESLTAQGLAHSELGYRKDDQELTVEAGARVAAAAISAWIHRLVVAGQEHIVDIPHLLDRYPSLSGLLSPEEPQAVLDAFNRLVFASEAFSGPEFDDLLLRPPFADRPMWWSRLLSRDRRILEVRSPSGAVRPSAVFCEDVSRFVPEELATAFIVDLPTRLKQRFVFGPSLTDRADLSALGLPTSSAAVPTSVLDAEDLSRVAYVPARRLLND